MLNRWYLAVFLCFFAVSCTRSPAYKKEQGGGPSRIQSEREREKVMELPQKFSPLRKRAVLLPFWNDTPIKGKFEMEAKNALRDMILERNYLNLVDERDISLRSQDFYLDSERINVPHVVENGKKWGVSLVVLGRISKIAYRQKDEDVGFLRPTKGMGVASVELRLVDIVLAKEIAIGLGAGKSENSSLNLFGVDHEDAEAYRNDVVTEAIIDALHKAMPALTKEVERIQWRGKIAKITGSKLYINAGRATGINVGDILKVNSQGQDVFDPETGLFLGRTQGDLKGTLEVIEFFGEDGSITRVHSGANFQEGDVIQLY